MLVACDLRQSWELLSVSETKNSTSASNFLSGMSLILVGMLNLGPNDNNFLTLGGKTTSLRFTNQLSLTLILSDKLSCKNLNFARFCLFTRLKKILKLCICLFSKLSTTYLGIRLKDLCFSSKSDLSNDLSFCSVNLISMLRILNPNLLLKLMRRPEVRWGSVSKFVYKQFKFCMICLGMTPLFLHCNRKMRLFLKEAILVLVLVQFFRVVTASCPYKVEISLKKPILSVKLKRSNHRQLLVRIQESGHAVTELGQTKKKQDLILKTVYFGLNSSLHQRSEIYI